ncbi:MAG: hypothetical protein CME15_12495 [Gemmatimonadetes bacterium]|jgi:hypothetical protein|nr:hypothetical protein [Gemmatimonadota bacterium]
MGRRRQGLPHRRRRFFGNIQPWQGELEERPRPCILAGLRLQQALDARRAFNSWFAVSLLVPDVARNTIRLDLAMRRFARQPT